MGSGKRKRQAFSHPTEREEEEEESMKEVKKKIRAEENAFMATKLGKSFFNEILYSPSAITTRFL